MVTYGVGRTRVYRRSKSVKLLHNACYWGCASVVVLATAAVIVACVYAMLFAWI